ncbi:helix-turn-helix domain-containing protein [Leptobacterium flavescens]|uniref:Helix-turn-helix domain-containing protein n=1 Tax=Leptobacterium flavescens TaxID=472055 RepID=A0A6P0UHL0_9FLAO|nr:AraC family transcriptional regulator [Leptobacterium flavescens]NER12724.1 helix-turn-helix domain-containing protein [Leptobacterium flavescens]
MRFRITPVFLILFLFDNSPLFSQERSQQGIIDSLKKLNYTEIYAAYLKFESDSSKAVVFAQAYLEKGKENNDTIRIANAYTQLGAISNPKIGIQYADSIISLTREIKHNSYPGDAFYIKGVRQYQLGYYRESLKNLLIAIDYAVENDDSARLLLIENSIAALKSFLGDHKDTILRYKKLLKSLEDPKNIPYDNKDHTYYLITLGNISSNYINLRNIDSATAYIVKGISESLKLKDTFEYYKFVSLSGYNEYYKGNHKAAVDSLDKAFFNDDGQNSRINYYLYKGRIARDLNNKEEAISHFKKLDSIYEIHKDPVRELPEVYQAFIDYYKEKGDTENQLKYIDKLLAADSILDANFIYLSSNITKEYDIPQLTAEKDKLIRSLQTKKTQSNNGIVILSLLFLLSGSLFLYYYRKQHIYKKKFGYLMQGTEQGDKIIDVKTKTEEQGIKDISEELIKKIIGGLNAFEQQNEFLDPSISLNSLSKKLHTNSNYLSKVINHYEQKNFSNYINDLRIDYTVEQLKTNKQFRLYSVKGIAEEVGFNSTESFSKAFFKRTGIYPSYFIKQLEKGLSIK